MQCAQGRAVEYPEFAAEAGVCQHLCMVLKTLRLEGFSQRMRTAREERRSEDRTLDGRAQEATPANDEQAEWPGRWEERRKCASSEEPQRKRFKQEGVISPVTRCCD